MIKKIVYAEPPAYFPEDLRKMFKLGEYAEEEKKDAMEEKTMDVEVEYISKETREKSKFGEYDENNLEVEMQVTVETKDGTLKADSVDGVEKLIEMLDE
jgi:hypothetical protein